MKQTQRILDQDKYPICVAGPFSHAEDPILLKWIAGLRKQGVRFIFKWAYGKKGKQFFLCRAITPQERAEIEAKRYVIRGGGFRVYPEEA